MKTRPFYRPGVRPGAAALLLCVMVVCSAVTAAASVPPMMNYQGYLTDDSGQPRNGSYSMGFAVYPDSVGGSPSWSEPHSSVTVTAGVFSVLLGSVDPLPVSLFTGAKLWLQTTVSDTVLYPRRALVTVPYSFRAARAESASVAVMAIGDSLWSAEGGDVFRLGGNVGIGTTTPAFKLDVTGTTRAQDFATLTQTLGNGSAAAGLAADNLTFNGTYGFGPGDQFIQFNSGFNNSVGGQGMMAKIVAYRSPEGYDSGEGKLKVILREGSGEEDALVVDRTGISTAGQAFGNGSSYANLRFDGLLFDASNGYEVADHFVQFNSGFSSEVGGNGVLARLTAYRNPDDYSLGRGRMKFSVRSGNGLSDLLLLDPGTVTVNGELCVTGQKNRIVSTQYGDLKFNATESAAAWFTTEGESRLENGKRRIDLDPIFLAAVTVNDSHRLLVNVTFYGPHADWYVNRDATGFTVIDPSGSDSEFSWEAKAKQKGYENVHLRPVQQAATAEGR